MIISNVQLVDKSSIVQNGRLPVLGVLSIWHGMAVTGTAGAVTGEDSTSIRKRVLKNAICVHAHIFSALMISAKWKAMRNFKVNSASTYS